MQAVINFCGPGFPRQDREWGLDKLLEYSDSKNIQLFWNQEELDFFQAYALLKGREFPLARLWKDRPWVENQKHDYKWTFIRTPYVAQRKLP